MVEIRKDTKEPTIYFEGELNEDLQAEALEKIIISQKETFPEKRIRLHLEKVNRGNSSGIFIFLKILNKLEIPFSFVSTPSWMVLQFSFLASFLSKDVLVESIQAEYVHPETGDTKLFIVTLGKDIPILKDYEDMTFYYTDENGIKYESNFSEDYLFFICHWYDKLKRIED